MSHSEKKVHEEFTQEMKAFDSSRDVPLYMGMSISILAASAAIAATIASYTVGFLETYRRDVSAIWMACLPFLFPVITGIAVGYRRQMSSIGVHVCLLMATLLAGGASYGYSIENVFINRDNCTVISVTRGDCHKVALVYSYVVAGGVAIGFSVLGLLVSTLACSSAVKRRRVKDRVQQRDELTKAELDANSRCQNVMRSAMAKQATTQQGNPRQARPCRDQNIGGTANAVVTHTHFTDTYL
ncbi:unnamed protein product [Lymnaea stagnalis]|uniref:Transmembrane protein n=1 Tax=Lymnaea stagnalis TaxID=6523 RepID=A0AAV2HWU3_LYMST